MNDTLKKLLDPTYDGDIILLQDNIEYPFNKFCNLPTEKYIYFMLTSKTSIPNLEEGELVILALDKLTFDIHTVNDKEELNFVHQEYLKLIKK